MSNVAESSGNLVFWWAWLMPATDNNSVKVRSHSELWMTQGKASHCSPAKVFLWVSEFFSSSASPPTLGLSWRSFPGQREKGRGEGEGEKRGEGGEREKRGGERRRKGEREEERGKRRRKRRGKEGRGERASRYQTDCISLSQWPWYICYTAQIWGRVGVLCSPGDLEHCFLYYRSASLQGQVSQTKPQEFYLNALKMAFRGIK